MIIEQEKKDEGILRPYDAHKYDAVRTDNAIKVCHECNSCWEIDIEANRNNKYKTIYAWYYNFPKYGKKVETCPKCVNKNEVV